MNLAQYFYYLPEKLIAKQPSSPRDNARLFVYDTRLNKIFFDKFKNLSKYLPAQSFFVFNNTKVLPARVSAAKDTGGKVELLFLLNEFRPENTLLKALSNKKLITGRKIFLDKNHGLLIAKQQEQFFYLKPEFPIAKIYQLLEKLGVAPIPKYIKGTPLTPKKLKEQYQTVFAEKPASVAAPTASLHFTTKLLRKFKKLGFGETFVTLHVGLGTFAPVDERNFKAKRLHKEFLEVSPQAAKEINRMKKEGRELIAVGTTAVRTLESVSDKAGRIKTAAKETDLFILPPYKFRAVDHLITNFHLPESSLMLLVEAFLKHKKAKRGIVELYKIAIRKKFRFYSFGDGMLIL